ncbi:hypothetical protein [Aestuariispira insulae]|uniref:Uncharacterized protein n=1 Tax=Aestuariispira insulae TaxID=1461337 RepID=A0A3D9HWP8_9PROT|nr:hypothetical protein [Aestuariispira insulae]RED53933.1 hypothetical protein DFP90_101732 [Aestuariispira insulae]
MSDTEDTAPPNDNALPYGPSKLAQLTARILDLVEDRVASRAARDSGELTQQDFGEVITDLQSLNDPELLQLINDGWEEMVRAAEEAQWRDERRYPLERLIIHHFEPYLAPRGSNAVSGQNLSRRVIPAFLAALSQMIGKELLQDYESRCREIVDQIQNKAGNNFDWELVYNDPNANILAQDIIVYIAQYFRDVPKRRVWMIDIFLRNMPPATTAGEMEWSFGNEEFHILVNALYADLFHMLKDKDALAGLRMRYGDQRLTALEDVEKALLDDMGAVL